MAAAIAAAMSNSASGNPTKKAAAANAADRSGMVLPIFMLARKVKGAGKAAPFDAFSEMPWPAGCVVHP